MRSIAAKIPMEVYDGLPLFAGALIFCACMIGFVMSDSSAFAHGLDASIH